MEFLTVELANQSEGGAGARMTGGGFGGCTINLVQADEFSPFRKHMTAEYRARTGIDPDIYAVRADGGVKEIVL